MSYRDPDQIGPTVYTSSPSRLAERAKHANPVKLCRPSDRVIEALDRWLIADDTADDRNAVRAWLADVR